MSKEGALILGIGGDNGNTDIGTFYEGVITSGCPSDATENAVQANITAAGYSSASTGTGSLTSSIFGCFERSGALIGDYSAVRKRARSAVRQRAAGPGPRPHCRGLQPH